MNFMIQGIYNLSIAFLKLTLDKNLEVMIPTVIYPTPSWKRNAPYITRAREAISRMTPIMLSTNINCAKKSFPLSLSACFVVSFIVVVLSY